MALRVLLADESSTIKKVMQLSLQDFAVDVRSVAVGLDVLSVSKVFKPDIIFADILLSKKNGYDVCFELKSDVSTQDIPVILMWSGFMELDEQKFQYCKANARLEKPFDAETLRDLVKNLVQKTQTNPISDYLTFASLPDFEEPASSSIAQMTPPPFPESPVETDGEETADEFSAVSLSPKSVSPLADAWSESSIKNINNADSFGENFNSQIDAQISSEGDFDEITFIDIDNGEPITDEAVNRSLDQAKERNRSPKSANLLSEPEIKTPKSPPPSPAAKAPLKEFSQVSLNEDEPQAENVNVTLGLAEQEQIFREESRKMIEKICWQILPEITERIVKEEINKLLKDVEKSI